LYLLVIRIGEILQFKQYHSENTPPFPEDIKAARWVMEYAEPQGIVNKYKDIAIDDTPLVNIDTSKDRKPADNTPRKEDPPKIKSVQMAPPVVETKIIETPVISEVENKQPDPVPGRMKINIVAKKAAGKKKIVIQKKDK
jgi:hypothetical protein